MAMAISHGRPLRQRCCAEAVIGEAHGGRAVGAGDGSMEVVW